MAVITKEQEAETAATKSGDGDAGSTVSNESRSDSSEAMTGNEQGTGGGKPATKKRGPNKAADQGQKQPRVAQGGPAERDTELESIVVEMRNGKRLFIDAKENHRGKFIKIAEAFNRFQSNRRPERINLRMKTAKELCGRLGEFIDAAKDIEEKNGDDKGESNASDGRRPRPIHSAVVVDEGRRYFIDLLHSRFKNREPMLRFSLSIPESGLRNMIMVEAGEASCIQEAIETLLKECYSEKEEQDDARDQVSAPPKAVRFGRRKFFFSVVAQSRGKFVKITERMMTGSQPPRSSVFIPDKTLAQFIHVLSDYDCKLNQKSSSDGGSETASDSTGDGASIADAEKQDTKE